MPQRRRLVLLLYLGVSVSSSMMNLFFVHLQAVQLVEEWIPARLHSFSRMEAQAESLLGNLSPPPSCIVADISLPYTATLAAKFGIPRFSFQGFGCLCLLTVRLICLHPEEIDTSDSDSDYFSLTGLHRIKFTRNQLPIRIRKENRGIGVQMLKAESESNGVIMNSFEELETEYIEELKKGEGGNGKIWCVGPVSLTTGDQLDRGGSRVGDSAIIDWLDSKDTHSIIYVCFGSTFNPKPDLLIELGLGLEASNQPFIWVIRGNSKENSGELQNWIAGSGFEERTAGRGLLVRGWAPQVAILSHRAVGGFLTHCGWNATVEGISAGVPLITWPLLGDQFVNEKLAVEVLGIGVSLGVEQPVMVDWEEVEASAAVVKREDVVRAVERVVGGGEEGEAMRKRATELARMARRAVECGGSSYENVTRLIEDVKKYQKREIR
ncbi:unnamed protein product [Linum tenue]|uniref:Glycosyltransferase n=1 Tax=Linum tenue TaxID=586396 RepID=A0AAV0PD43_9ROSI|nr:unnamed protein product [Linum tenue]